jgi:hypothetical protein
MSKKGTFDVTFVFPLIADEWVLMKCSGRFRTVDAQYEDKRCVA